MSIADLFDPCFLFIEELSQRFLDVLDCVQLVPKSLFVQTDDSERLVGLYVYDVTIRAAAPFRLGKSDLSAQSGDLRMLRAELGQQHLLPQHQLQQLVLGAAAVLLQLAASPFHGQLDHQTRAVSLLSCLFDRFEVPLDGLAADHVFQLPRFDPRKTLGGEGDSHVAGSQRPRRGIAQFVVGRLFLLVLLLNLVFPAGEQLADVLAIVHLRITKKFLVAVHDRLHHRLRVAGRSAAEADVEDRRAQPGGGPPFARHRQRFPDLAGRVLNRFQSPQRSQIRLFDRPLDNERTLNDCLVGGQHVGRQIHLWFDSRYRMGRFLLNEQLCTGVVQRWGQKAIQGAEPHADRSAPQKDPFLPPHRADDVELGRRAWSLWRRIAGRNSFGNHGKLFLV